MGSSWLHRIYIYIWGICVCVKIFQNIEAKEVTSWLAEKMWTVSTEKMWKHVNYRNTPKSSSKVDLSLYDRPVHLGSPPIRGQRQSLHWSKLAGAMSPDRREMQARTLWGKTTGTWHHVNLSARRVTWCHIANLANHVTARWHVTAPLRFPLQTFPREIRLPIKQVQKWSFPRQV